MWVGQEVAIFCHVPQSFDFLSRAPKFWQTAASFWQRRLWVAKVLMLPLNFLNFSKLGRFQLQMSHFRTKGILRTIFWRPKFVRPCCFSLLPCLLSGALAGVNCISAEQEMAKQDSKTSLAEIIKDRDQVWSLLLFADLGCVLVQLGLTVAGSCNEGMSSHTTDLVCLAVYFLVFVQSLFFCLGLCNEYFTVFCFFCFAAV